MYNTLVNPQGYFFMEIKLTSSDKQGISQFGRMADEAAAQQRAAAKTGIPAASIPPEDIKSIVRDHSIASNPTIKKMMDTNPKALVYADYAEDMNEVSSMWSGAIGDIPKSIGRGLYNALDSTATTLANASIGGSTGSAGIRVFQPQISAETQRQMRSDNTAASIERQERVSDALPFSQAYQDSARSRAEAAKLDPSLAGSIKAVVSNPWSMLVDTTQSLSEIAPTVVAGGGVGGAIGGAVRLARVGQGLGIGLASANAEYTNTVKGEVLEQLSKSGKPVTYENLREVTNNPQIMAEINRKAAIRSGVIGSVEGLTGGAAGVFLRKGLAGLGAEAGMQTAGGAAGEALAQVATDGRVTDNLAVAQEAVGGAFLSLPEYVGQFRQARATERAFTENLSKSTLHQKDQEFAAEYAAEEMGIESKHVPTGSFNQEQKTAFVAKFPEFAAAVEAGDIVQISGKQYVEAMTDASLPEFERFVRDDVESLSLYEAEQVADANISPAEIIEEVRREQLNTITARVFEGLDGSAFKASQRRAYADFIGEFYDATSARLGITPEEMANIVNLQVQSVDSINPQAGFEQLQDSRNQSPFVDSIEFNNWAGNSVLRDADGQPLIVHRGVPSAAKDFPVMQGANFFTSDPAVAESFSAEDATFSGYLRMAKPLIVEGNGAQWNNINGKTTDEIAEQARRDGYDGVIFRNIKDIGGNGNPSNIDGLQNPEGVSDVFVSFDGSNFKSTDNNGQFSDAPNVYAQAINGIFNPDTTMIQVAQSADFSTFIHESGHFFLDTYEKLLPLDESGEMRRDMETLLDWAKWNGSVEDFINAPIDIKRDVHEQFARGYEAYVMEGKEPSSALKAFFDKFSEILKTIYRTLAALDAPLTDDVREVMGRMISSEQLAVGMGALGDGVDTAAHSIARTLASDAEVRQKYNRERAAEERRIIDKLMKEPEYKAQMMLESGIDAADIWQDLGYQSEAEMLDAVRNAPDIEATAAEMADASIIDKYGSIPTVDKLREIAMTEAYNDDTLDAMAKRTQSTINYKTLTAYAKNQAVERVQAMRIVDLAPNRHRVAEQQIMRRIERMRTDNPDRENLIIQRLQQAALVQVSGKAKLSAEKRIKELRRIVKTNAKNVDGEFKEQIQNILSWYELSAQPKGEVRAFSEFAESLENEGIDIVADVSLLRPAPVESLTVSELDALYDTIKQIETVGRNRYRTVRNGQMRDIREIQREINESIAQNWSKKRLMSHEPRNMMEKFRAGLDKFFVNHKKAAAVFDVMDGGKGALFKHVLRPLNEASARETTMRAEATKRLLDAVKPILNDDTSITIGGRELTQEMRFTALLNMGNDGNMQRLLSGYGWTIADAAQIARSFTAEQLEAAQKVWDIFESYKPEVARIERMLTGTEPKWIEPKPMRVLSADGKEVVLRGGYYPAKYDTKANIDAARNEDNSNILDQAKGRSGVRNVRKSFTKARSEKVSRPILLSMQGTATALNETIHAVAFGEALHDVKRVLSMKNPQGKNVLEQIHAVAGNEYVKLIRTWLDHVAAGEDGSPTDSTFATLRRNVSKSLLGYSVTNSIAQVTGLVNGFVVIGARHGFGGFAKVLANPRKAYKDASGKSEFMRNRSRTYLRDIAEVNRMIELSQHTAFNRFIGRPADFIGRYAYSFMTGMQTLVDTSVWQGAYDKAMLEGYSDVDAIALADQAVIDSQGDGSIVNLSGYERGGEVAKVFTGLYSYMNTVHNTLWAINASKKRSLMSKAYANFMILVFAGVLEKAIKESLIAGEEEDDFEEKLAKMTVSATIENVLGQFIIFRELGNSVSSAATGETAFGFKGTSALSPIANATKLVGEADDIMAGEADASTLRAAVSFVGSLTGLPSAQINRTIKGIEALEDGKTDNPAAVLTGYKD